MGKSFIILALISLLLTTAAVSAQYSYEDKERYYEEWIQSLKERNISLNGLGEEFCMIQEIVINVVPTSAERMAIYGGEMTDVQLSENRTRLEMTFSSGDVSDYMYCNGCDNCGRYNNGTWDWQIYCGEQGCVSDEEAKTCGNEPGYFINVPGVWPNNVIGLPGSMNSTDRILDIETYPQTDGSFCTEIKEEYLGGGKLHKWDHPTTATITWKWEGKPIVMIPQDGTWVATDI